jgi:GPH family glycoside/pentoside/hexuronide:cation symporter
MTTASTIPRSTGSTDGSPHRPFGLRDKIGYMFGDFGNDFTFILQTAFFLIFYTNVMGINPAHVGTLLFVARIVDAFTDVGAGRLIDVLKPTRHGRFRPWLLRIAVPVAVSAFLMFSPFLQDGSYGARLAWMIVTYMLWGSVFYTLINIPYGSMASVISHKPTDRASLSVFRALGAKLAQLAIMVALPAFVYVQVDGRSELDGTRMMIAAGICGVLAIACYLLCFANVEERVEPRVVPASERLGFAQTMRTLVTNRALTGMIVGSLLMLLGTMMLGSMVPYVFNDYFNHGSLLSVTNLAGMLPALVFLLFATRLARRFGKRELGVCGLTLAAIAGLLLFVVKTDSPIVFLVGYAALQLGVSVVSVLIWAIITDVIDFQDVRTGERSDATVYALYSWARKLGQALAGGLSGWALGWIGYQSGGVTQTDSVLGGIYSLSTLVPAVLFALSALCLAFWYPLSKNRVLDNAELLVERRLAQEEQDSPA